MTHKNDARKTYHHGDLRRALLDKAAQILREEGESGLTLRKLASRAGVSHTAPYHHFKDKHELLSAIAEEGFRRFIGILTLSGSELSERRLRRFVREYLDFALDSAEYYDLMFGGHLWKSDNITEALKQAGRSSFRSYVDQVRGWQEQGLISADLDVLRYSQVSWSTLHGMSRLLIDGIYLDRAAMSATCDQAAKMLWQELRIAKSD